MTNTMISTDNSAVAPAADISTAANELRDAKQAYLDALQAREDWIAQRRPLNDKIRDAATRVSMAEAAVLNAAAGDIPAGMDVSDAAVKVGDIGFGEQDWAARA